VLLHARPQHVLYDEKRSLCNRCKENMRSIDHLATRCGRMLYYDYTWRHNEVARCLHLLLCRKFGIIRPKRLKTHRVSGMIENSSVSIRVDMPIKTDRHVQYNKSDIVIHDKLLNEATIVDIGITFQDCLQAIEL
jgi:hypothetical protein